MSINCTNKCIYQWDGQCNLSAVQTITQSAHSPEDTDCPYHNQDMPADSTGVM